MARKQATLSKRPEVGERTPPQGRGGVAGFMANLTGFSRPPGGTFDTYRKMRGNPTIALARMAATAPIRVAKWAIEAADGVAEGQVRFLRDQITPIWPMLIKDVLYALDYGFQAFEKVFEVRDGRIVYRKLKALSPENTEILADKANGAFAGIRQGDVELGPEKCFMFTYDGEAGNHYGRSRHENIREDAWHPWVELSRKRSRYFNKVAGVIPVIEYPEGESQDASGATQTNFDLARAVLQNLGDGKGVAMPNVFARYAGDLARSGIDLDQLKAWHISFLETNQQHGQDFADTMRHLESLMLRGWLVPERAATEGRYGTKAEAQEHGRLALAVADLLLEDIIRFVNWYLVNPLMVLNFGPRAENSLRLVRSALDLSHQAFLRRMIENVLAAPPNVEMFLKFLDIDAVLDSVGLPRTRRPVRPKMPQPVREALAASLAG